MKIQLLKETDEVAFFVKPAGMLVIPDRFDDKLMVLKPEAEKICGQRLWTIHRLDKGTSGVIVFAKNEEAHKFYSTQFQERQVEKTYKALVHGQLREPMGEIDAPIIEHPVIKGKMITAKKGKASLTSYKVEVQWKLYALLHVQIHTGRTHQIRVHLSSIGHSVVADELYGNGKPFFLSSIKRNYKLSSHEASEPPLLSRPALHAFSLKLKNEQGEELLVEAPLPKDMRAVISQLQRAEPV